MEIKQNKDGFKPVTIIVQTLEEAKFFRQIGNCSDSVMKKCFEGYDIDWDTPTTKLYNYFYDKC